MKPGGRSSERRGTVYELINLTSKLGNFKLGKTKFPLLSHQSRPLRSLPSAAVHSTVRIMSSAGGGVADAPTPQNARVAMLRLASDLRAILEDPPAGVSASPVTEDNLFTWNATIVGPEESPWEGAARAAPTRSRASDRLTVPPLLFSQAGSSFSAYSSRISTPTRRPASSSSLKCFTQTFSPTGTSAST